MNNALYLRVLAGQVNPASGRVLRFCVCDVKTLGEPAGHESSRGTLSTSASGVDGDNVIEIEYVGTVLG